MEEERKQAQRERFIKMDDEARYQFVRSLLDDGTNPDIGLRIVGLIEAIPEAKPYIRRYLDSLIEDDKA